jgi:hypothetical protein
VVGLKICLWALISQIGYYPQKIAILSIKGELTNWKIVNNPLVLTIFASPLWFDKHIQAAVAVG